VVIPLDYYKAGTHKSISLECSSERNIELDINDENSWAVKSIRAGTTALTEDEFSDFLNNTENVTFGFFAVKIKEFKGIYLMAISNDTLARRLL
jgi:hypothetical protein